MAMARDIMDAIGEALADLPNADQVWPRMNVAPDGCCIDVFPDPAGLEEQDERGFSGSGAFRFVVRARAPLGDNDASQDVLIDWMDPTNPEGVEAFIDRDNTLGGLVNQVEITAVSGYTSFVDVNGKTSHVGALWNLKVLPAHS